MDGTSIGLSKKQSYVIGAFLMMSFLVLAIPFGDDLFINIPLAISIQSVFGLDIMVSLILTYTLIPISFLIFGAWIYPGSTMRNLKTRIQTASKISHRLIYNPFVWSIAILATFLLWQYYIEGGSSLLQTILTQAGL